jgi:hypothetical protein
MAFQVDPIERALGDGGFLRGVSFFRNADHHGMAEACSKHGMWFVKIAAGTTYFVGSHADQHAVDFDVRSSGRTGDFQRFAKRWRCCCRRQRRQRKRGASAHVFFARQLSGQIRDEVELSRCADKRPSGEVRKAG